MGISLNDISVPPKAHIYFNKAYPIAYLGNQTIFEPKVYGVPSHHTGGTMVVVNSVTRRTNEDNTWDTSSWNTHCHISVKNINDSSTMTRAIVTVLSVGY